jgi:hypothetical protein
MGSPTLCNNLQERATPKIINQYTPKHRKLIDPKPFKGEAGQWEEYSIYYGNLVRWNGWEEEEALDALMLCLAGDAATYIHSLQGFRRFNLDQLCDKLGSRFGAARTLSDDKRRLRSRKKRPDESYDSLCQDVMRLATRVYKSAPGFAEQEGRDAFINALPAKLRGSIAAANPKTIEEALTNVNQMLTFMEPEDVANLGASSTRKVREVEVYATTVRPLISPRRPFICFNCGEQGHRKDQCEKPKATIPFCFGCGSKEHLRTVCTINPPNPNRKWIKSPRNGGSNGNNNGVPQQSGNAQGSQN